MNDYLSERIKDNCDAWIRGELDLNSFRLKIINIFAAFPDNHVKRYISVTATKNGEG